MTAFEKMVTQLRQAKTVVLTTHRRGDGDGFGAQVALYLSLKKLGKNVRIVNVDLPAPKYQFLSLDQYAEVFNETSTSLQGVELCLALDTNDARLIEPLYSAAKSKNIAVAYLDHHPVLEKGPVPEGDSFVDISAASTGEIVYRLLHALEISLDAPIARALYTSLVFDTHLFRYIKSDSRSHTMAAELLKYEREPELIHRKLFANYTAEKLSALSKALASTKYFASNRAALVMMKMSEQSEHGLESDETSDVLDQIMNIESMQIVALVREELDGSLKVSLRSRGQFEVLKLAESLGGGGHRFASGAYLQGNLEIEAMRIADAISTLLNDSSSSDSPKLQKAGAL